MTPDERKILVQVLIYHYRVWPPRNDGPACGCGWNVLGGLHPEHVVTVFEESIAALAD